MVGRKLNMVMKVSNGKSVRRVCRLQGGSNWLLTCLVWPLTLGSVRRHQSILAWWYAWKVEMKPRGRVGKPTNVSPNIKLPRWAHLDRSLCLNTSTVVVSLWPNVKATCILTELYNYGVFLLNISKHHTSTLWHVCDRCRNWRTETWSDFWGGDHIRVHF